ncbi:hypothetical protein HanHA300_Chr06g0221361 [Helianthus annuus]|nr:hypothetical protein HanHA300_Chr06g0221361 [Helianthus annuus]
MHLILINVVSIRGEFVYRFILKTMVETTVVIKLGLDNTVVETTVGLKLWFETTVQLKPCLVEKTVVETTVGLKLWFQNTVLTQQWFQTLFSPQNTVLTQ